MRRLALILLGLALVFTQHNPAQAESTLEIVKKRGKLLAGVRKKVPNFGMTNEKGEIVGFDVEIAKGIAAKLGVGIELVPVTSSTRTALLQQGRIDLIAATMTHYRKRDPAVDFSVGYFYSPQTLLVAKNSGIKGMADMAGKRAGTAIGAGAVENMKKVQPKITVQTFEGYPEAFLALQQGLIDAVGTDIVILAGLRGKAKNPSDFVIVPGATFGGGEYGIGVRENDSDWRDAVNHALMDMWKDGSWMKAFNMWIGPGTQLNMKFDEMGFKMHTWR